MTHRATYAPFTPSNPNNACRLCITAAAGTELAVASSSGTIKSPGYLPGNGFSQMTGVYDPKAFILHAASLCQAFAHCKRSSTAASRRSLGSVSVPVWLTILSDQLPVSLGGPLPHQLADGTRAPLQAAGLAVPAFNQSIIRQTITSGISPPFGRLSQSWRQIAHVLRTLTPLFPRMYCYTRGSRSTCMPNPRCQRSL